MTSTATNIEQQELPAGWKWVKLGDVLLVTDYVANGSFASLKANVKYRQSLDYAILVRLTDFRNNWDKSGFVYVDKHAYEFLGKSSLRLGDIVICNVGATVGTAFVVPELGLPMTLGPNSILVKPLDDSRISMTFFYYWITSDAAQAAVQKISPATAQPKFNKTDFKTFVFPLPPLEEQKRIAGILNEQMAAVEEAKKAAQERLQAAKALPSAYLREVFPSSEDELPAGWKWVKLGDVIANVQPGFACGTRAADGIVQLRMNNVTRGGGFNWDELTRVPSDVKDMSKYWLQPNDVLFNNTNSAELVGKSALFESFTEGVVYSNHFSRLRPDDQKLDAQFLAKWLLDTWANGTFESICNRWVGQAAVPKTKLLELPIPLPPLEEQKRIASELDDKIAGVKLAEASIQQELDTIEAMPAALLRKAFSGGL